MIVVTLHKPLCIALGVAIFLDWLFERVLQAETDPWFSKGLRFMLRFLREAIPFLLGALFWASQLKVTP